jgi:phosphatidylglycerophosphate synthase
MQSGIPALGSPLDPIYRPVTRVLHERLGLMPSHITWASLAPSLLAAVVIARGHVGVGLCLMALGQLLDAFDGAMARHYQLVSPAGHRLDTLVDRLSEAAIFLGFWAGGFVSLKLVACALVAIALLTSVVDRAGFDPGAKRMALYFGHWFTYPTLFTVIFGVNLTAYVISLLVLDCRFQLLMDRLGGDLDTIATRGALAEAAEEAVHR